MTYNSKTKMVAGTVFGAFVLAAMPSVLCAAKMEPAAPPTPKVVDIKVAPLVLSPENPNAGKPPEPVLPPPLPEKIVAPNEKPPEPLKPTGQVVRENLVPLNPQNAPKPPLVKKDLPPAPDIVPTDPSIKPDAEHKGELPLPKVATPPIDAKDKPSAPAPESENDAPPSE